jgi:hypothetical protein
MLDLTKEPCDSGGTTPVQIEETSCDLDFFHDKGRRPESGQEDESDPGSLQQEETRIGLSQL